METILAESISEAESLQIKVKSAPNIIADAEVGIKPQLSAPSYLNSLKENDLPPFKLPVKEARPKLVIGTIVNEAELIDFFVAAGNEGLPELKRVIGRFLVEKKLTENYNLSEKNFLISLLTETIDYGAQRDFHPFKLSVLMTIYLQSHLHFKWFYWQTPNSVWGYFKEIMIRHTVQDSPDGQEVFTPEECYNILTHFHTIYLSNLPLIHLVTFGTHRLKFVWPFKPSK